MRLILLLIVVIWSNSSLALGEISAKYESAGKGPGTISSGINDPGGKSYGVHQLALNTGTLLAYIKDSAFKSNLYHHPLGSAAFDKAWKHIAKTQPEAFEEDQLKFIAKTHFWPLRRIADTLGYRNVAKINEAIFSMGVQHGKAHKILRAVAFNLDLQSTKTDDIIRELYAERSRYVKGLSLHSSTKAAILNRYISEQKDIIGMK